MTKKIIILLLLFGLIVPSISFASAAGVELLKSGAEGAIDSIERDKTEDKLDEDWGRSAIKSTAIIPKVNFPQFIGTIIKTILAVLGVIFIVLVIYAGSIWVFSMGDASKIGKAKSMLIAGVIGMIIIVGSYIIVSFIISSVSTPATSTVPESTEGSSDESSSNQAGPNA